MRKRRLSKALAMFLAAALTIPAAVPVAASESTADKEETVYVKTNANGEEKTVIVSDWLKNFSGEAKIKDATDLTDVENVKGNETYKRGKKDSITWNANGKDIYYQGTSDKNLPVSMKVTYYLDGQLAKADDARALATENGKTMAEKAHKLGVELVEYITKDEALQPSVFTDVKEGSYYVDAVNWAVDKKVTSGKSETTFAPNDSCTRAQAVTFLWRAAGSPEPTAGEMTFTDVKADSYYDKRLVTGLRV